MNINTDHILLLIGFLAGIGLWRRLFKTIIIYDYQKGLLYRKGIFKKTLAAGKYIYFKPNSSIDVIDMRQNLVTLPGQEILTKDNVNIKVALLGFYTVNDPEKTRHSENYYNQFYNICQLVLRDQIGLISVEELLATKNSIEQQMLQIISEPASDLGLSVSRLAIKDIILPGNLRKAFSGILEAQKDAQRQLEKARGEQAVLRKLANSSGMYESNPALLQARLIQALSSGNNSIVFTSDERVLVKQSAGGQKILDKQP